MDLITDLLGTPSPEAIARVCFLSLYVNGIKIEDHKRECVVLKAFLDGQVRNEKARRYLGGMRKKKPVPFSHKFPNVDPLALHLLEQMLAFEPKDRPTAEEVD